MKKEKKEYKFAAKNARIEITVDTTCIKKYCVSCERKIPMTIRRYLLQGNYCQPCAFRANAIMHSKATIGLYKQRIETYPRKIEKLDRELLELLNSKKEKEKLKKREKMKETLLFAHKNFVEEKCCLAKLIGECSHYLEFNFATNPLD